LGRGVRCPRICFFTFSGPSRAILLLDNPLFEIDLKVKGQGSPSEDKALSYYVFPSECHRHRFSILKQEQAAGERAVGGAERRRAAGASGRARGGRRRVSVWPAEWSGQWPGHLPPAAGCGSASRRLERKREEKIEKKREKTRRNKICGSLFFFHHTYMWTFFSRLECHVSQATYIYCYRTLIVRFV
jgi:hypothetical protein